MFFLVCLLGLCWGSFLNVLVVRTLSGESIISPPSKCPKCNHQLYWWHNIPLVSYLILQGRCYFCNKSISIRYPLVELLGMIISVFAFLRYVSIFDALAVIFILSVLFVISYTDFKDQKISVLQMLLVMAAGIIFNRYNIYGSIAGIFAGAGVIALLSLIGIKVFNKETFGVGDIYLFGTLGSIVCIDKLFLYMLYVLLIQFIFVLPEYILGLIRNNQIKTLKYLIVFVITCLFLYVSRNINFMGSNIILMGFLMTALFFAYKLVLSLFSSIKEQESSAICPLAPAIAISCLIFLC